MKTIFKLTIGTCFALLASSLTVFGQSESVIPPSNRSTTSMEKNLLFFANQRFSVSQNGASITPLHALFDGNLQPVYSDPINESEPCVILIENLPNRHVQAGSWIGWTTRFWPASKFKIEVYNIYDGANNWITVADESNYSGFSYIVPISTASVGKIRFTFYTAGGPHNELGISELFFIHPEATTAYDNLMVQYNGEGNVGIGTTDPKGYKLAVAGNMIAESVKVQLQNTWPDYVFTKSYKLPTLQETEKYIKDKGHLPGIPSAAQVKANGVDLGEMNGKLLQKIEELTLHLIEKNKNEQKQELLLNDHKKMIEKLIERVADLEKYNVKKHLQ